MAWLRWCDTRRRKSEPTGNTNFDLNRRASLRPYLGAKQARGDVGHSLGSVRIRAFAGHGRRGADADQRFVAGASVAQTADEDRHVGALAAAVGMKLVKDQEFEVPAFSITFASSSS